MHTVLKNFPPDLRQILSRNEGDFHKEDRALIFFFRWDETRRLFGFIHFSSSSEKKIRCNENDVEQMPIAFYRVASFQRANTSHIFAHIVWIIAHSTATLKFTFDTQPLQLIHGEENVSYVESAMLQQNAHKPTRRQWKHKVFALFSAVFWIEKRYKNSWLFVDRDFKADDNAEHLYRWVQKNVPQQKIYFALDKKSPDWNRLQQEGFHLIDLKSHAYGFAYLHCDWLISSNITNYITKPKWHRRYADIVKHQFCFLQHGVTKDYQPTLTRRKLDLFITSTRQEYESLAEAKEYGYVLSKKEVALTGMPRHDALLRKALATPAQKQILVMPTWREYAVGPLQSNTGQMAYNPDFRNTRFYTNWIRVLSDETLENLLQSNGYSLCFFPHPYLRQQLDDFRAQALPYVKFLQDTGGSIQDILTQSALLITDYSSIAFDFALLMRPVVYFQFDAEEFAAKHSYHKGYFDYTTQGFGPVMAAYEDLSQAVQNHVESGCTLSCKSRKRIEDFFTFFDQENCSRVYKAILCRSRPQSHREHNACETYHLPYQQPHNHK